MSRLAAFAVTTIGLAFVALGVLILLRGDAEDRALAFGCIAFFGACAVVGALNLAPKRRIDLKSGAAFVLLPDALQSAGLILGGAGLSAGCFLLAPIARADGDVIVSTVGWIGGIFFGLGVPVGLWRLLRRQPIARLDSEGVESFGPNGWSLKWRDVHGIGVFTSHDQRFLAFDVDTSAAPSFAHRVSDALGLPRYAISVTGSNARIEDVEALARALWAQSAG